MVVYKMFEYLCERSNQSQYRGGEMEDIVRREVLIWLCSLEF